MSIPEVIKPQTKQELAVAYEVSTKTISNWLKPFDKLIGKRMGRTYTPKQVSIIYNLIGPPPKDIIT